MLVEASRSAHVWKNTNRHHRTSEKKSRSASSFSLWSLDTRSPRAFSASSYQGQRVSCSACVTETFRRGVEGDGQFAGRPDSALAMAGLGMAAS